MTLVSTTPFSSTGPHSHKTVVTVQAELAVGFVAVDFFFFFNQTKHGNIPEPLFSYI